MNGLEELSELPVLTLPEKGGPPKTRIKDVKAANTIYENLRDGDKVSAINRMRVQAMFDGTPPYSDQALRESGQAFRTNLNFGEGEKYLEQALSAYVDLINSVEQIVRVQTKFGTNNEQIEWNRIISEEYSFQLRKWDRFHFEFINLCHHFVGHGVGVTFFEDDLSWQARSTGLGDILIPRGTKSSTEAIEIACAVRAMDITELYRYIENEKAAEKMGWNVEEVKKAIRAAYVINGDTGRNWEDLQVELKNNDLQCGAKSAKVKVVHLWSKEFDGSVSHYVTLENAENKDFLCKQIGKYENISRAFTFFTYGIGTNGTFHSIRGLGYKIFPQLQLSNRIRSQAVDNAMLAGAPMVQPNDERALENLAFNYLGPFAILPPNVSIVDRVIPNVSQTMMPILNDLGQMTQERAGQYSTAGVFGGDGRKTRFEVAAHLEEASKLNITALNLFYVPWDCYHVELSRRFWAPRYSKHTVGYQQVNECRNRCLERGVPEEALDLIDWEKTRTVRAVGNGSAANRMVQLQQLNELAGTYDELGRHNLFRDQTAALVGHDAADRYIPAEQESRLGVQAKVAQLENDAIMNGAEILVLFDEVHPTHLDLHLPKLEEIFQMTEEGQMELTDAIIPALPLFTHCVQHLEQIQGDTMIQDKIKEYNQRLQKLSEMILNGQKALAKEQEQAEQEAVEGEQVEQQQGPSPETQAKFQEHQIKLQMMQEQHQMKQMIKLQEHQQKMALEDAKGARDIREFLK